MRGYRRLRGPGGRVRPVNPIAGENSTMPMTSSIGAAVAAGIGYVRSAARRSCLNLARHCPDSMRCAALYANFSPPRAVAEPQGAKKNKNNNRTAKHAKAAKKFRT